MKNIAIIPARGGSKRIPGKNIKQFQGKPMIHYAIEAALASGVFDEVMVSTDSEEVADVALSGGASVPFMRSERTSDDFAVAYDVLEEVVSEYKKRGADVQNLCCIYPCVPFLTAEILNEANARFRGSCADTLLPVVRFSFPIQRAFRIGRGGCLEYREPEHALARSQDLEPMYHDAGMFFFCKAGPLFERGVVIGGKTSYMEIDEETAQDIDTVKDWQIAERKYRILHNL